MLNSNSKAYFKKILQYKNKKLLLCKSFKYFFLKMNDFCMKISQVMQTNIFQILFPLIASHIQLKSCVNSLNRKLEKSIDQNKRFYTLNINNQTINSQNCIRLLRIEIHNLLTNISFGQHISNLRKKASNQLNPIGGIQKNMGFKEDEVLSVLSYLILIIVLLCGISVLQNC